MTHFSQDQNSSDLSEVTKMINELAVDMLFKHYDCLPTGMQMRLSNVTKDTQRILDELAAQK